MSELQDMTGHDTAAATDLASRAGGGREIPNNVIDQEAGSKPIETAESLKADRSKPITLLGVTLPNGISNTLYSLGDTTSRLRFAVLKILPGFVVNHSSNAIGMTQLVGEALYFKSSGVGKFVEDHQKGSWKVIFAPPTNIVRGVFKKSAFQIDYKQLLNPEYMGGELKRFFNLKEAARVDFARDGKLSNRWSARSGFSGMTSMAIAAAFPDEKDDPKVTEKAAMLSANNKLGYAGYRLGQGLLFPITAPVRLVQNIFDRDTDHHVGTGKREFAGIGMTLTGFFSVLAGFRQPREKMELVEKVVEGVLTQAPVKKWAYDFNKWQAMGGMITTYAGLQLLMSIDNQQGWTNYGKTQFGRLAVLPMSIKERFPNKAGWGDPNAKFYFGAQGVFQFKNVVASLIGGAQKLPDGTIIDQKKVRAEAQARAHEHKAATRLETSSTETLFEKSQPSLANPSTFVSNIRDIQPALPDRLEAHEQQKVAAV